MKKQISPKVTSLIFGILVICFAIAFYSFAAWQEPAEPQPGGNVPAPLNTGPVGQTKIGGLILNTGGAANGLIVDQGNVGIGTRGPSQKLDVIGNIIASGTICDSNGCIGAGGDGGFWLASGNNIYNTNTGNVGIGTMSPGAKLQVDASGGTTDMMLGGNAVDEGANLRWNDTNKSLEFTILGDPSNTLVVANGGNVGIGTINPASKLQVAGGVQIGNDTSACNATKAGTLRYNAGRVEYCDGSRWRDIITPTTTFAVCASASSEGPGSVNCGGGIRVASAVSPCTVTSDTGSCTALSWSWGATGVFRGSCYVCRP